MRLLRAPLLVISVALAATGVASHASAHGGEDHGPPVAAEAVQGANEHVSSSETELFIVVLKYPPRGANRRLPVRVYVADATTGAPLAGASVRLEIATAAAVRATEREPGVYEASIAEPPAGSRADAVVTVEAPQVDLLTLPALAFGPMASPQGASHTTTPPPTASRLRVGVAVLATALGVLLLSLLVATVLRRTRAGRHPSLAAKGAEP